MTRLMTMLLATSLSVGCAVEVDSQDDVALEASAFEADLPGGIANPEGPGSCAGWAHGSYPGYVVVPVECVAGTKYYDMGDPWVEREIRPDESAE